VPPPHDLLLPPPYRLSSYPPVPVYIISFPLSSSSSYPPDITIEQAPSFPPEIPAVVELCTLAFAHSSLVLQVAPTSMPGIVPNLPSFRYSCGLSFTIARFKSSMRSRCCRWGVGLVGLGRDWAVGINILWYDRGQIESALRRRGGRRRADVE